MMAIALLESSQLTECYSPSSSVTETIRWLLELGLPPLPVAPYHDPALGDYYQLRGTETDESPLPKFNGKNPSFLTRQGKPILIRHKQYRSKLPSLKLIKRWFTDLRTGVATMGGWRNIIWVDIDAKRFDSVEACQRLTETWIECCGLSRTYIERTHRGGYHVALRVADAQQIRMTAFRLDEQILQAAGVVPTDQTGWVGEVIKTGVPIVLAPTRGVVGQYRCLHRAVPMAVENLEQVGLLPTYGSNPKPESKPEPESEGEPFEHPAATVDEARTFPADYQPIVTSSPVFLNKLLCQEVRELIRFGHSAGLGERSDILTRVAREALGWQQWMAKHGYGTPYPDADTFIFQIGSSMRLDQPRIGRILESRSQGRPIRNSMPSIWHHRGDQGCLNKLRRATY